MMKSNKIAMLVGFVAGLLVGIALCVLLVVFLFQASYAPPPSAEEVDNPRSENLRIDQSRTSVTPIALQRRRIFGPVARQRYQATLDRMRLKPGASLSIVLHGMHLYGCRFNVPHPRDPERTEPALEIILNHEKALDFFTGGAPLVTTRYGVRCRTLVQRDARWQSEREAHTGQLLAVLAEYNVPLNRALTTSVGEHTVSDILADTIANFSLDEFQLEWNAVALALYHAPYGSWRNKFGIMFTFNDLVETLVATRFDDPRLSCQGTHLLYSLAVIFQADRQHHMLSEETRSTLHHHLETQVEKLVTGQQSSGCWPVRWFSNEPGDLEMVPADRRQRLGVTITGHHLEWLLLLPQHMGPPEQIFAHAATWLDRQFQNATNAQLFDGYCPYCHAAFAIGWTCDGDQDTATSVAATAGSEAVLE